MSGRYNHSFADGELELAQTGFGSLTWRCVIGNGHLRMRELHLTRMNDVPPNEKRVAGVLYEVGCMARRVARLTDRGDARNQMGVLIDERYLPGFEIWTNCCAGLFELPLQSLRVFGSVLPGHKIFEIALVDINDGVGELSDSTNSKASGVVSMDVGQQNRVDLLRLISCCL